MNLGRRDIWRIGGVCMDKIDMKLIGIFVASTVSFSYDLWPGETRVVFVFWSLVLCLN